MGQQKWSENNTGNVWRIVIGVNSSCRPLHELALAGPLLLHPPHPAHGPDVLHARDAALPAVKGKAAWGRGSAAIPARTRRSHRMGVCPHWRCMWWTGESAASGKSTLRVSSEMMRWFLCSPTGIQLPLVGSEGPWCVQTTDNRHHADGVSADDRHQWHHVLRGEHFWTGTLWGEESFRRLCLFVF